MVYLLGILKNNKRERLHAPGFESPDAAVAAFVARDGIYREDWVRLDAPGPARYIRYEEIKDVRGASGPSMIP